MRQKSDDRRVQTVYIITNDEYGDPPYPAFAVLSYDGIEEEEARLKIEYDDIPVYNTVDDYRQWEADEVARYEAERKAREEADLLKAKNILAQLNTPEAARRWLDKRTFPSGYPKYRSATTYRTVRDELIKRYPEIFKKTKVLYGY